MRCSSLHPEGPSTGNRIRSERDTQDVEDFVPEDLPDY